jgi:endoglucanase
MKKITILLTFLVVTICSHDSQAQKKVVERFGQLSVKGSYIMGQNGDTVQLRGMSLFWSQWMGQYYNADAIKWLRDDWKCTVIRAAMGVDNGGYLTNPQEEKENVFKVVDAAIDLGIYVIIDYHSHDAYHNVEEAKKFFSDMSKKYGKYPNVLYEIFNEPLQDISWAKDIKPYEEEVIKAIRKYDPDNIVIAGTRQWSQLVLEAAKDPIKDLNTVYTLHFYAASHGKYLIDEAQNAINAGVALFVSEFGTCDYSGNGELDLVHTREWLNFLDARKISWCNWSVADKEETASALNPGASGEGNWKAGDISPSGKFIREELIKKNGYLFVK